ncbi:MAG TPA: dihydrofolate reductase family protein [Mucilaginibacter sp.]|jgi:dihydrofolate reductase|nr:dihydrofolate reductase family protein [Mucilaginibacter sp.]
MRKLKLQMQLSIDGFVAGPNGEMDWMSWNWDDGIKKYVTDLTNSIDCILLGGHMPGGFIPYWESVAANPDDLQYEFGKLMTDTAKVVFTKTIEKSEWNNTVLAKGDITEEVNHLKAKAGKDIITYGGANFASNLIKYNLIDEYHLFINPTIIGNGMTIFKDIEQKLNLKLVKAVPFECGIVVLCYEPAR